MEKQYLFNDLPQDNESRELYEHMMGLVGFAKLMSYYKCAMMALETKFNVLNEEYSLRFDRNPISTIKTRLKTPFSICAKLKRRSLPINAESIEQNLNDIAGVRVVCPFLDDVYAICDTLLKQDDIELIEMKDYIKNPKSNGYRSLHLIVSVPIFLASEKRYMKAEIQLRTLAMDCWATIEHQLYYNKQHNPDSYYMQEELAECAKLSAELDMRMNELGSDAQILHRKP